MRHFRVGATILLRNGYCYQSYSWNYMRPLGKAECVLNMLENYEVDEISIIRPVRTNQDSFFKKDLEFLKEIDLITPVAFGGGIKDADNLHAISKCPVERIILSSAFVNGNQKLVRTAINIFGSQAVIASIPISFKTSKVYDCSKDKFTPFSSLNLELLDQANEILIYDVDAEGKPDTFDFDSLLNLNLPQSKLILSGGIGHKATKLAKDHNFAAVHIENRVLHKEFSIRSYKHA